MCIRDRNLYRYNLGAVLSHEIGHWIGYCHTFGCYGIEDCNNPAADDFLSDTPQTIYDFRSIETFPNASTGNNPFTPGHQRPTGCNPDGPGQMLENFMDYSYNTYWKIFSKLQKLTSDYNFNTGGNLNNIYLEGNRQWPQSTYPVTNKTELDNLLYNISLLGNSMIESDIFFYTEYYGFTSNQANDIANTEWNGNNNNEWEILPSDGFVPLPTPEPECGLFTFTLEDSYGDGWQGGSLEVRKNGEIIDNFGNITLLTGAGPLEFTLGTDYDDVFDFIYTPGIYTGENSFKIYDVQGNFLAESSGTPGTTENGISPDSLYGITPVSYTHLTLPTNREV